MLHLTPDTWYVTCGTWHMTHDMWNVTHGGGCKVSLYFCSPALMVWARQCLDDSEQKDHSMNESWMN